MYSRESAETEPKMKGKCLKFHRDRGFGFLITADPTMPDIFCHFSDITQSPIWRRQFLLAGMTLDFDIEDAPTPEYPCRLRARNVRVTAPITMAISTRRAAEDGGCDELPSTRMFPSNWKDTPNWVGWKTQVRDGKRTKVPYDINSNRDESLAKSDDSSTWTTFARARDAADILDGSDYEGVGFEFQGTNFAGIDFDSAITSDGAIDPYVLAILNILGKPYTEVSPSGTGLHSFVECSALPAGKRKFSKRHVGIEIYHGSERGRYFTITGDKVFGNGVPVIAGR